MTPIICFPNKLAKPGTGVIGEFTLGADGSKPAVHRADGESVDLTSMGASCSPDPGNEAASCWDEAQEGECGKRLGDSLWPSEDLGCGSAIIEEVTASGAVDSHRAISLDAAECLPLISNLSGTPLVRSTALEDLTSIGDRSLWVEGGEELISSEHILTADDSDRLDSGATAKERHQSPHAQRFSCSSFDSGFASHSEDLRRVCDSSEPGLSSRSILESDGASVKMPSGTMAEGDRSDSWLRRAGYSKSDICSDSEMHSVAQTTGTAELQKTRQSSPARKSMVPVAIFKGLFAVIFTTSDPALFS